jgi:hypothetical protein
VPIALELARRSLLEAASKSVSDAVNHRPRQLDIRLGEEGTTMYQVSVYAIEPSLWRWELRSGGALLRCGTAPTRVAAERAANQYANT